MKNLVPQSHWLQSSSQRPPVASDHMLRVDGAGVNLAILAGGSVGVLVQKQSRAVQESEDLSSDPQINALAENACVNLSLPQRTPYRTWHVPQECQQPWELFSR